jgi:hypothetical protein
MLQINMAQSLSFFYGPDQIFHKWLFSEQQSNPCGTGIMITSQMLP